MTAPNHHLRRVMATARLWRRIRIVERRAARRLVAQAAAAASGARDAAADPVALTRPAPTYLAETRHALVSPEAALHGRAGRWVV
jgi:hypothetical protein